MSRSDEHWFTEVSEVPAYGYFRGHIEKTMFQHIRSFSLLALMFLGNASAQWVPFAHPPYESIYSVTTTAGAIYMVSAGNGVIKSTDGGSVWNQSNTGLPASNTIESVAYNGSILFCGTHSGIYRSTDLAGTWALANTGLPTSSGVNFSKRFFQWSTTTFAIYSASIGNGGGVWRTTDNGQSWFSGNAGLSTNMTVFQIAEVGGVLFVATSVGLYKSNDLGVTWAPFPASNFAVFAIQGTATRMYAITSFGFRYFNFNPPNAGWNDATGDPSNPAGGDMIIYDGKIWALTGDPSQDVLRSTNDGVSYVNYEAGLVGADVIRQYAFHASGTTLYLGTFSKLYGHSGTTVGVDDGSNAELPKAYPTLFTDAFMVDLSAQVHGMDLVLLDAMGREVQRKNDLPAAPCRFDRGVLPSGTYRLMLVDPSKGTMAPLGAVIAQ